MLATACVTFFAALPAASGAAALSPESRIFIQMDFPDGLPIIASDSRTKAAMAQRWQEALARGGLQPHGEPVVATSGLREQILVSPNRLIPASELPMELRSQVWNEFWVVRSQSPVEGKTGTPSTWVHRYALRCQPLTLMQMGWLSFKNLDGTGEPSLFIGSYRDTREAPIYRGKPLPGHMVGVERTCGKELAEREQAQARGQAKNVAERVEDLQKVLAVRAHRALDPDTAVAIGRAFRASMEVAAAATQEAALVPSTLASAAEPTAAAGSAPGVIGERAALFQSSETTAAAEAAAVAAAMERLKALQQDPTVFDDKGEPRPARVRLYGVNGGAAMLHKGAACYSDDTELRVAGGLANAFKSLTGTTTNLTIGMPATERSREVDKGGWNMGNQWYYQEHEIPAAELTTVRVSNGACQMVSAAFMAVPGVDYEARMVLEADRKRCIMTMNRILPGGELKAVPILPAKACTAEEVAARRAAVAEHAAQEAEMAWRQSHPTVPPRAVMPEVR
ncbi:hypothetical protein CDN98_18925 [Roseateles terrae]|nr:hypothetical protein CDN98_18925 [Roseateles terrae]